MRRIVSLFLIFFPVLALLPPVASPRAADLQTVTFIPQWAPQSQFAGYYVAQDKGFYRNRGLEVKILTGGPNFPPSELLRTGQADFGTMFLTNAIVKRAQGDKFVNIGQVGQRSALMLVAKKSSGIKEPKDINGKKVALWGEEFQIQPRAFFQQHRLQVKILPQGTTMNLFLRGGVEVASAMWYNEYYRIIQAGIDPGELTTFLLSDYGLKFPEDGIYCLESTYQQDPGKCRNFVQASLEGWRYAFTHVDEALDIVMKYVNAAHLPTNRVHQKWMLERMRDIIQPPGADIPMGCLQEETYNEVTRELKNFGLIGQVPDFHHFYRDCRSLHEK
ncbi:MAG: ABC transporter substrate-binding protein [Deltaproteobacteria bacterium]|nr:MAG: ABC transporter substrate-binding protein [Deltaproteobacteria bacterium]